MSTILDFQLDTGNISIELLDTNIAKFWLDHFLRMSAKYSNSLQGIGWPYYRDPKPGETESRVQKILSIVNQINNATYLSKLPLEIDTSMLNQLDLESQKILNKLHRCAVVGSSIRDRWINDSSPTFDYIPYGTNNDYEYLLNLLNQQIHGFEELVVTPHREQFNKSIRIKEIKFQASQFNDVTIYHDDVAIDIPRGFESELRLTGYDVWIKKDLLGKDFITAFADHDDPHEFDIHPPVLTSGALHIDLNQGRDILYSSPEFRNWLGMSPTDFHGNYPLGNVISGKENISQAKLVKFCGVRGGI